MARTGASTRRERFLPYRYARNGLTLSLSSCTFDGGRRTRDFDAKHCVLNLSNLRFTTLTLGIAVQLSQDTIAEVYPEPERSRPRGRLLVVVRCSDTRLRRSEVFATGEIDPGIYRAEVVLARTDVHGVVELMPYLVREGHVWAPVAGYAVSPGVRLASGRSWEVRVDGKRPSEGTYLDVRYVSFSEQGPNQFPWPDNLYQLDCERDNPTLWLNSDHQTIAAVLNSRATVGTRARMRDVFFDYVTTAVWTRLFIKAANDLLNKEETVFDWQDKVLSTLLPTLYPEFSGNRERLAELRQDYGAGDLQAIMDRLDAALQQRNDICRHMQRLVEALG